MKRLGGNYDPYDNADGCIVKVLIACTVALAAALVVLATGVGR